MHGGHSFAPLLRASAMLAGIDLKKTTTTDA
jgi:hypothetical protein